jgi:hypothetical protein
MLTPQEQAELNSLNAELFPEPNENKLTPEEQAELASLNAELFPQEGVTEDSSMLGSIKKYGKQFAKQSAMTGRNIAGALGSTADFVSLPITAPSKALGIYDFKPIGDSVEGSIDKATGDYTKPKTDSEKLAAAVTKGVTEMLALGGTGKLAKLGTQAGTKSHLLSDFLHQSGKATKSNIAGTTAGAGAAQLILNNDPDDRLLALAGGVGAGGLAGALAHNSSKILNFLSKQGRTRNKAAVGRGLGINPEIVDKLEDAGMPLSMNVVSDSDAVQRSYNTARKAPMSGKGIRLKDTEQLNAIEEAFGLTPEQAKDLFPRRGGELAQEGVNQYHKARTTEQGTMKKFLEGEYEKALASGKVTPVVDIANPLLDLRRDRKALTGGDAQKLYDSSVKGKILKFLNNENRRESGSRIPDIELHEKFLNNKVDTWGLIGNQEQTELKKLSRQLSKSVDNHLGSSSPEAKRVLAQKNALWHKYEKEVKEKHFNSIMKAAKESDEAAFIKVFNGSKATARKLKPLYEGFDQDQKQEFTHIFLSKLGTNTKGEFNAFRMADKLRGYPKDVREVLFSGYDAEAQRKLPKILNTMEDFSRARMAENTSGTAASQHLIDQYKDYLSDAGQISHSILEGKNIKAATLAFKTVLNLALPKLIAEKGFTNSEMIKDISNAMKVTDRTLIPTIKKLSKSEKSGQFLLRAMEQVATRLSTKKED